MSIQTQIASVARYTGNEILRFSGSMSDRLTALVSCRR